MNNLFNAVKDKYESEYNDFALRLSEETEMSKILSHWSYTNLIPVSSKDKRWASIDELKAYLLKRKRSLVDKVYLKESMRLLRIEEAKEVKSITISVEWKKSAMWGMNPKADCEVYYTENSFNRYSSSSISGCGYDKLSTAVAQCQTQINGILKPLYELRDKDLNTKLHELFGYGSGYGLLPSFEGGVGVDCYPAIFEKIGYKFSRKASGKTFDVFEITKLPESI